MYTALPHFDDELPGPISKTYHDLRRLFNLKRCFPNFGCVWTEPRSDIKSRDHQGEIGEFGFPDVFLTKYYAVVIDAGVHVDIMAG
jgi:hypothetical protein